MVYNHYAFCKSSGFTQKFGTSERGKNLNNNHKKEINIISIIIFFVVIMAVVMPLFFVHQKTRAVTILPSDFSNGSETFEHRMRTVGEEPISLFSTTITSEQISGLPKTDLGIIITKMDGQGYKLWWNGRFIGQAGDPYAGRANTWNSTNVFLIEGGLIQDTNTLVIQTYALYEVGIYNRSVQITSWQEALRTKQRYDLLSDDITLISIGMAIFAAITILVHTILHALNKEKMLAIAAAMIFMSFYGIDYLQTDYFFVPYLVYKKIVTTSLFLSVFFVGAAAGASVKSKVPIVFCGSALIFYVVGESFIRDIVVFKHFYNYALLLLPINIVVWLIILARKVKFKDEARIFFGMLSISVVIGVWEVVTMLYLPYDLFTSPFPFVIIEGALLTMFLALSSMERNRELQKEMEEKDLLFQQAITDAQTQTYNKAYFANLIEKLSPPFVVAMVDIDNFKALNDNYGHLIGDEGILVVVKTIKEIISEQDSLGRYGGDEFLLALRCSLEAAKAKCEQIRQTIEKRPVKFGKIQTSISVSIGLYQVKKTKPAEKIIHKADMALYGAKEAGKNCISVYQKKSKND